MERFTGSGSRAAAEPTDELLRGYLPLPSGRAGRVDLPPLESIRLVVSIFVVVKLMV